MVRPPARAMAGMPALRGDSRAHVHQVRRARRMPSTHVHRLHRTRDIFPDGSYTRYCNNYIACRCVVPVRLAQIRLARAPDIPKLTKGQAKIRRGKATVDLAPTAGQGTSADGRASQLSRPQIALQMSDGPAAPRPNTPRAVSLILPAHEPTTTQNPPRFPTTEAHGTSKTSPVRAPKL